MDQKPYHILDELYKLFEAREGKLSDREIGYFTGQIRALLDLYWEPEMQEAPPVKQSWGMDIKRRIVGD